MVILQELLLLVELIVNIKNIYLDIKMDKSVIQKLIKEVTKAPELEYSDNLLIFKENIESTIKLVKRRLGLLQTLLGEVDYELTISHTDEEIE